MPIEVEEVTVGRGRCGAARPSASTQDEHLRPETTLEALAKLRPVFKEGGTVTAGNSSPLSDGAAAVLVMERSKAEALGLTPILRFVGFNVGRRAPGNHGHRPDRRRAARAERARGMSLDDIDVIELNEAFAAQSLAVIRELGLDEEKTNVNGGAIALGHPLGCTGAKLTVQLHA